MNDFGCRGASKVYKQRERCRKSREARKTKQADQSKENIKDYGNFAEKVMKIGNEYGKKMIRL